MSRATEMPLFEMQTLQGSKIDWSKFDGKYLLFVNVASACGFTPQYKGLQKLYETQKDQLEIIGLPCNQFGAQEPGNADEIASFCELNFGVSFTLTEKIAVKGANQHPLYKWLTDANENGIQEIGEPTLPNVQVELLNGDEILLASTFTDSSGFYEFSCEATSAAKSSTFFSIPSPTSYRMNRLTLAPAADSSLATV